MIWYKNNNSDIVVSTRIRLARNVDKTPFPNALKDTKEVTEKIKNAVLGGQKTGACRRTSYKSCYVRGQR